MRYCDNCGKAEDKMKCCVGCKCAHYCNETCQNQDWRQHKKYCKRLKFVKFDNLTSWTEQQRKARPEESELFRTKLAAARASGIPGAEAMVLLTPVVAEKLLQACDADSLPGCEEEERIWGLYGDPRSAPYQRRLLAYQKAVKYGDLSAEKLMECLLARPNASQALTQALAGVRVIHSKKDVLQQTMYVADRVADYLHGIEIDSEFDRWPIKKQ